MITKNNIFYKFLKSNRRICMGRSHQVGLLQKLQGDPSGVYYIKLNIILTECFWRDSGRLKLYDKNSREIPAEYTTVN